MSWSPAWIAAAARVVVDADSGRLTLVDLLDGMVTARVPASLQGFALAARFSREEGLDAEGQLGVRFERQDGDGDWEPVHESTASFTAGQPVTYAWVQFRVLRVRAPGPLRFRLSWRADGGRWRRGPVHALQVILLPDGEQLAAQLDALPPLG